MKFLIRTIEYTSAGREIVRDREFTGDVLTIGRDASNAVHLPDLAVEQFHARITPATGGQLRASAVGTLGFTHDGRQTNEALFDPQDGAELGFGNFRLEFSRDGAKGDDAPIIITQRRAEERKEDSDALKGFSLADHLPSKRAASWIGLGLILLAFLAVPIYFNLTRAPAAPDYDAPDTIPMDASWSTGALTLAHHGLEDNCEACHVNAFVAVRDEACLTCHKDIGDHAPKARQLTSRGPMSLWNRGLWSVAETFGKEGPGACTTCHTEHEGMTRMAPPAQQFCADCHLAMDQRLRDTSLGNASDFGKAHPQFKALVFTKLGKTKPHRISLAKDPREQNGLRFPHKLHLSKTGGVARMAMSLGKYRAALTCKDCHKPTSDEVGFKPVDMEEDCEACHSLVYDKVGPTFRTLKHGDVAQMLADLRAMDRAPRAPVVTPAVKGRKRPGEFGRNGRYYQRFGRPGRSLVAINRAMARNGVCGECHYPAKRGGKPAVTPVNLPDKFFVHARFDHKAHNQEKCSTCHEAAASKTSSDVLIPKIAICRDCHLGEDARKAEVPSSCAMCHSYHPTGGKPPKNHPAKVPSRVARLQKE